MTAANALVWDTRETARQALAALSADSDRLTTVWAMGVITITHCSKLGRYIHSQDPFSLGVEYAGGVHSGWRYQYDRRGVIAETDQGQSTAAGWREIAQLLNHGLASRALRDDIAAAGAHRGELIRRRQTLLALQRTAPLGQSLAGELVSLDAAWIAHEGYCEQLAAAAWIACRPAEQESLFNL